MNKGQAIMVRCNAVHCSGNLPIGAPVKALYAYEARGADELSLKEDELIELSSGPSGGQSYGQGWWEGENPPDAICAVFTLDVDGCI